MQTETATQKSLEHTVHYISNKHNPATTSIQLTDSHRTIVRALMDTGAEINLVKGQIYRDYLKEFPLQMAHITVRGANGQSLHILGKLELEFYVGHEKVRALFYVCDDIRTSVILGQPWLIEYRDGINLGKNTCTINDKTVELTHYDEITSLVRLTESVEIAPRYLQTVYAKIHTPGLEILKGICKSNSRRRIPITIVNSTGKPFTISKGCVITSVKICDENFFCGISCRC